MAPGGLKFTAKVNLNKQNAYIITYIRLKIKYELHRGGRGELTTEIWYFSRMSGLP